MHAFFVKNKGGREDGVLGRLGCEAKLSGQFLSERRMLNQLKGLISILLGSVQHLFR